MGGAREGQTEPEKILLIMIYRIIDMPSTVYSSQRISVLEVYAKQVNKPSEERFGWAGPDDHHINGCNVVPLPPTPQV